MNVEWYVILGRKLNINATTKNLAKNLLMFVRLLSKMCDLVMLYNLYDTFFKWKQPFSNYKSVAAHSNTRLMTVTLFKLLTHIKFYSHHTLIDLTLY